MWHIEGSMPLGLGFEVQKSMSETVNFSSSAADQEVELSTPSPAPCLLACCYPSHRDDNELTFWNCKLALN